jgi:hypothetical protein
MCVSMFDKPFDAEACDIGGQASATNGLSDMKTHIKNASCNRPLMHVFEITVKSLVHNMLQNCFRYALIMIQICFINASYMYLKEQLKAGFII